MHIAFDEGNIEDSEIGGTAAADLAHHGEVLAARDKTMNDVEGSGGDEMEEPPKRRRYMDEKNERIGIISSPDAATMQCCHHHDRVYAHRKRQRRHSAEDHKDNTLTRSDFVETVFFAMALRTDNYGVATTDFDLSESITK